MCAAIVNHNLRLMFSKPPKKDSELCFVLDIGCHVASFHSSLYLPSDKTAPHSRDWCHMGIELFPDITPRTTSERVQFLFNQNFHSSFFLQTLGAARKQRQCRQHFSHSFVWSDNVSGGSKMSNREFGQCFVWSVNLLSTPWWFMSSVWFQKNIFMDAFIYVALQPAFSLLERLQGLWEAAQPRLCFVFFILDYIWTYKYGHLSAMQNWNHQALGLRMKVVGLWYITKPYNI